MITCLLHSKVPFVAVICHLIYLQQCPWFPHLKNNQVGSSSSPDEPVVRCLFCGLVCVGGPYTKREGKKSSSHRYNCSSLFILFISIPI